MHDQLTTDIARDWIDELKAAWYAEDAAEFTRIAEIITSPVNRPLGRELQRQWEEWGFTP